MKFMKKSLSIILSVLMFASVCSCLLSTTVSAADADISGTYVFNWKTDATGTYMTADDFVGERWFEGSKSTGSEMTANGAFLANKNSIAVPEKGKYGDAFTIGLKDPDVVSTIPSSALNADGVLKLVPGYTYEITAEVNTTLNNVEAGIVVTMEAGNGSWKYGCVEKAATPARTWTNITATIDADVPNDFGVGQEAWAKMENREIAIATSQQAYIRQVTVVITNKNPVTPDPEEPDEPVVTTKFALDTYELDKNKVLTKLEFANSNNAKLPGLYSASIQDGTQFDAESFTVKMPETNGQGLIMPFALSQPVGSSWFDDFYKLEAGKTYRFEVDYAYKSNDGTALAVGFSRAYSSVNNDLYSNGSHLVNNNLIHITRPAQAGEEGVAHGEFLYTAKETDDGCILLLRFVTNGSAEFTVRSAKLTVINSDDNDVSFVQASARSIRAEGTVAGKYQSAGIRFRGTIDINDARGKADIGFVVIPTSKINGAEKWFAIDANGNIANSSARKVGGCMSKIYASDASTATFQLIVTGLTKEDKTEDLKDLKLTAVMYVLDNEGNYTYYYVNEASYNDVKAVYNAKDVITDNNGLDY